MGSYVDVRVLPVLSDKVTIRFHMDTDGDELGVIPEYYGGAEDVTAALVAADIVPSDFFAPRRRGHVDFAGRKVHVFRRNGRIFARFMGDPFKAPRLPGITRALIDKAIQDYKVRFRKMFPAMPDAPAPEPERPITYSRATVDRVLKAVKRISSELDLISASVEDSDLGEQLALCVGRLDAILDGDWLPTERDRPSLRLVVDNTAGVRTCTR